MAPPLPLPLPLPLRALGLLRYAETLAVMNETHARVVETSAPGDGEILVVEHPPVVTMGNRPMPGDMILSETELEARGIDFHKIDRGGSVTVHEPGQAVVYPIVKLDRARLGAKAFVTALEEAMIALCAEHGFEASRNLENPGVWVGNDKIGAIGIRIADGVTKHGLAFNLTGDLATFAAVVPCGLRGRGVTSLRLQLEQARETKPPDFASASLRLATLVRQKLLAI